MWNGSCTVDLTSVRNGMLQSHDNVSQRKITGSFDLQFNLVKVQLLQAGQLPMNCLKIETCKQCFCLKFSIPGRLRLSHVCLLKFLQHPLRHTPSFERTHSCVKLDRAFSLTEITQIHSFYHVRAHCETIMHKYSVKIFHVCCHPKPIRPITNSPSFSSYVFYRSSVEKRIHLV